MPNLSDVMGLAPGWVLTIVNIVYFGSCVVLMGFILMQRGRGGGGLAFGMSGGSQAVVGASTADNILRKVTKLSAGTFMACALLLAAYNANLQQSVMDVRQPASETPAAQPAEASAPDDPINFTFTPKEEAQPAEAAPANEPVETAPATEPTAPAEETAE